MVMILPYVILCLPHFVVKCLTCKNFVSTYPQVFLFAKSFSSLITSFYYRKVSWFNVNLKIMLNLLKSYCVFSYSNVVMSDILNSVFSY